MLVLSPVALHQGEAQLNAQVSDSLGIWYLGAVG